MNLFFIYMVKVAVYITVFYLIYLSLLSRDTAYKRNRAFILIAFLSSLALPLLNFHFSRSLGFRFFGKVLSDIYVIATSEQERKLSFNFSFHAIVRMLSSMYVFVLLAFILKLSADLIYLIYLIRRHKQKKSRTIIFHDFTTSGFSALGYIFINRRLDEKDASEIIKHEQNHLKHNHFLDIIFIEIIKSFQWFNPCVYLLNRSLREIHEFQADEECLNTGVPVIKYQNLLMRQIMHTGTFNLSNSFSNPSLIKKRMIMMSKKRTSRVASFKLAMTLPVVIAVYFTISSYKIPGVNGVSSTVNVVAPPPPPPPPPEGGIKVAVEEKSDEEEPFVVVEEMPSFRGGDAALLNFINNNVKFPESAIKENLSGKVIVRFCVSSKGKVNQISILKGISPDLDREALRVVSTLPDFIPGRQGGKPVPVWYMVPINFLFK